MTSNSTWQAVGIMSEVRLNLQKLRWCLSGRLSLAESGGKASAEDREICFTLNCPLKLSLCTTYLVEVNNLKSFAFIFNSLVRGSNNLTLSLCSSEGSET